MNSDNDNYRGSVEAVLPDHDAHLIPSSAFEGSSEEASNDCTGRSCDWSHLPYELLVSIFSRFDDVQLSKLSFVCKAWDAAACDDTLWRRHFRDGVIHGKITGGACRLARLQANDEREFDDKESDDSIDDNDNSYVICITDTTTRETYQLLQNKRRDSSLRYKNHYWKRQYLKERYGWDLPMLPPVSYGPVTCWESNFMSPLCISRGLHSNVAQLVVDCLGLLSMLALVFCKWGMNTRLGDVGSTPYTDSLWSWWTVFSPIFLWAFVGFFLSCTTFRLAVQWCIAVTVGLLAFKLESSTLLNGLGLDVDEWSVSISWSIVFSPLWVLLFLSVCRILVSVLRMNLKSHFLHRHAPVTTDSKEKEAFAAKRYRPLLLLPSVLLTGAFIIALGIKLDQLDEMLIISNDDNPEPVQIALKDWFYVFLPLFVSNVIHLFGIPLLFLLGVCLKWTGSNFASGLLTDGGVFASPCEWWWRKRRRWNSKVAGYFLYFVQIPALCLEVLVFLALTSTSSGEENFGLTKVSLYSCFIPAFFCLLSFIIAAFFYRPRNEIQTDDILCQEEYEWNAHMFPHFMRFPSFGELANWPIEKAHILSWWAISVVFSILFILRSQGTIEWSWWAIFLPTILSVDFAAIVWYRPRSMILCLSTFVFLNFFSFQLPWALSLSSTQAMTGPLSYTFPTLGLFYLCFLIVASNEMPFRTRFSCIFLSASLFAPACLISLQEKQMINWPNYAFFVPIFLIQFAYYLVVVMYFMWSEASFKWSYFGNLFTVQELTRRRVVLTIVTFFMVSLMIFEVFLYMHCTTGTSPNLLVPLLFAEVALLCWLALCT